MRMDYYSILGVPRGASEDEIKKAYRKLASQHHPDKGGDTAKFQEIQSAYETLGNPQKRNEYDNPQPQGFQGHPNGFQFHFNGGGDPFADIFSQFNFGPGQDPFAHMRQQQQRRNKDLRVRLNLNLSETLTTQQKTISVQTTTGERQTVHVEIPRGVTSGTSIKYSGLGDNMFNTLPRGDLYVTFVIDEDPRYQIHGIDLVYSVSINAIDAMLGCAIDIPSLEGRTFSLNVPAGTAPGSKFRIPNQGLYTMDPHMQIRGSLIVSADVVVPLLPSPEQIELLKQLKNTL
jgi:DnaJ-class molecular chaperone